MDLSEIAKHTLVGAATYVAVTVPLEKMIDHSSMSSEDKLKSRGAVAGAVGGAIVGYFIGEELARKASKQHQKGPSMLVGAGCGALAGYVLGKYVHDS